jgi:hypothetical protein
MAARGFLGAGDLYIRRMVAGVFGPWQGKYECSKFEIKPNVETKEMVSKGRDTYGQVIESVTIPQPADLTVALSEVNKESLAIALLGTVAAVSQASGTLTAVDLLDVVLDTWIPLEKANLTGNPELTNAGDTITYVEGEDYLVEKTMGWVRILSTGAIAAGADLKFTSTYGATSGSEIKGMTDPQLRCQFRLEGKNFADGLPFRVIVYEAVIAADSAFDFLQDDFASVELPGRMKTPTGYNEPFLVVIDDAAA